jgi:hypothetical protein
MQKKIVCIGWDGRSNPIYRFYRDIENKVPDHMRPVPSIPEILVEHPDSEYYMPDFTRVKLSSLVGKYSR